MAKKTWTCATMYMILSGRIPPHKLLMPSKPPHQTLMMASVPNDYGYIARPEYMYE